jgi:crotonobetainyl-CoA:carnitine CoA-transferase CaiB-like acyl-CoA transferase
MKPLDGIRIIDFSRLLAAPSATQALAELGAEVIKIERPGGGDETRQFEPRYPNGESGYYFAFNRGKRSVAIDLKSAPGRELARDLIRSADVVVENFVPGTMEGLGLGYAEVSADRPGLVYVSASGFGQTGPNRDEKGYDTIFQALSGIIASTGQPDGPPAKSGVPISDLTSGLWVVIAVLTGLMGRSLHGAGCAIDVSMMDVQFSLQALSAARIFALDEDPTRTGTEHPGRVPSAAFEASDGEWLHISASDQHWAGLCAALGIPALADDPDLRGNAGRVAHRARVMTALTEAIGTRTRAEVVGALRAAGVPVGEVLSVREALATPQSTERDIVQTFTHPTEGEVRALRTPLRLSGWDDPDVQTPPMLGADTDGVLSEVLGLDAGRIRELREQGVVA